MYDTEYLKEVAKTIHEQLYLNKMEVWAWGSSNFTYLNYKIDEKTYPSLQFFIRTPKYPKNVRVIISYDIGSDAYIVSALKLNNVELEELGRVDDVHFPELHHVINSLIEDKETYTKVNF